MLYLNFIGVSLLGVLVGDIINIWNYYSVIEPSKGYIGLAWKKLWLYHLIAATLRATLVVIVAVIANNYLHFDYWGFLLFIFTLAASLVGIEAGIDRLLADKGSEEFFESSTFTIIIDTLIKSSVFVNFRYGTTIQIIKEQDNYDCQNSQGEWDFGLDQSVIGRRLRVLYEWHKLAIANRKKNSDLFMHQVGVSPFQRFYLLVSYLGRPQLIREMSKKPKPLPPKYQWSGEERRRKQGSRQDRKNDDSEYRRGYDNKEILSRIESGKAC